MKKSEVYVIDIDGTICNNTYGAYEKADPYPERIDRINHLYDEGNIIIYYTARGMGRFEGDQIKVNEVFYEFTRKQLEIWGCKYHELRLGKLSYDHFICDKAENADSYFNDTDTFGLD